MNPRCYRREPHTPPPHERVETPAHPEYREQREQTETAQAQLTELQETTRALYTHSLRHREAFGRIGYNPEETDPDQRRAGSLQLAHEILRNQAQIARLQRKLKPPTHEHLDQLLARADVAPGFAKKLHALDPYLGLANPDVKSHVYYVLRQAVLASEAAFAAREHATDPAGNPALVTSDEQDELTRLTEELSRFGCEPKLWAITADDSPKRIALSDAFGRHFHLLALLAEMENISIEEVLLYQAQKYPEKGCSHCQKKPCVCTETNKQPARLTTLREAAKQVENSGLDDIGVTITIMYGSANAARGAGHYASVRLQEEIRELVDAISGHNHYVDPLDIDQAPLDDEARREGIVAEISDNITFAATAASGLHAQISLEDAVRRRSEQLTALLAQATAPQKESTAAIAA